ncbi:acyltransferase [Cytobacillus firmus]|uniref:acyltransferase n=1 Tax=Cytobacillus firmus TaxID=1399 RepID=UPI001CFE01FA|nr:acyltransferase [Cytobacillus firmus]
MKRRNLDEIQMARAFAIIAVLVVHTTSEGVTIIPFESTLFPLYNFLNIAGKLGTPTFIMLSSFVLFYNYYRRDMTPSLIKNFYIKRLKFILLPYFIFSLIYFSLDWYLYNDYASMYEALKEFLWDFSLGKAYMHLYFVFISVQLYIMFPVLMVLFKRSSFLRKHAIWIGLAIQWIWVWANREYFQVQYKGSISLSYMSFYFVGAYLGIHYDLILEKFKNKSYRISALAVLITGYLTLLVLYPGYMYITRTGRFSYILDSLPEWIQMNLAEFTWATHALFAGVMLFFIAHVLDGKLPVRIKSLFMEIGAVSFGVYLVHPMLLILFRSLVPGGVPIVYHTWQVITFFGMAILSWLIVRFTYSSIPAYWVFFGKMPPVYTVPKKEKEKNERLSFTEAYDGRKKR